MCCLILGAYKQKRSAFSASYRCGFIRKEMRLAVPYIQNKLHDYNDHTHTAHRNADIGLF